jgi:glycosyl transferase family 87
MISATSELSPAAHARIRRQIALIPVYIWVVYSWTHVLTRIPADTPVRDFAHFYVQGVVAREHDAAALYDIDAMAAITSRVVPGAETQTYPYPPVYGPQVSVFFSPLARLPYRAARDLWLAITLAIYTACCYALWRVCRRLHPWPWTTAGLLAAAPVLHFTLGYVQASMIGLACVTAGYLALRAGRPFIAGLAIGMLAYKPPLGLAFAFVFVCAREWRIVGGAALAAAMQIGVGLAYWGPAILRHYLRALTRLSAVANAMEPNRYHMHSWRAFFDLLGLPAGLSYLAYLAASLATAIVALRCWRAVDAGRGLRDERLALAYSALLVASVLIDPHLFAYDLVLLIPVLMVLADWAFGASAVRGGGRAFRLQFGALLYLCYFAPLFALMADLIRVQGSVLVMALLEVVLMTQVRQKNASQGRLQSGVNGCI